MKTILVVDDSPTIRRMVISSLVTLPAATFIEAGDGLEAIEQLAIHQTHLMVLDLNLPNMHGMEVLKFVRSHPKFNDLPVIILTTKGDDASRNTLFDIGASAYLTKPFQPTNLLTEVQRLLPDRIMS